MRLEFLSQIFSEKIFSKKPKDWLFPLLLFALLPWLAIFSLPDKNLHLYFFDVGQGDSIFIRTPKNYKILIDGGPDKRVLTRLDEVLPFYDRNLDLIISTHPHADHVAGLIEVVKRYKVDKVLVNPIPYDSGEYQAFQDAIKKQGIPTQSFLAGDKITLSDGVILTSFWPTAQTSLFEILDPNVASMVIHLDFSNFSALFTADAEFGEIPELENLDWEQTLVLKVPHQGSRGAVTKSVLEKLKPQLAIISVGPNKFGHPDEEVIELLSNLPVEASAKVGQAIKILRTDKNGTVEIVSDGKEWYSKVQK